MARALELFANTADGVFAIDDRQRIVLWNKSAEHLLGLRRDEVLGQYCYDVIEGCNPSGKPVCRQGCKLLQHARDDRPIPNLDLIVKGGDGQWLRINCSVVILPSAASAPEGRAVILFRRAKASVGEDRGSNASGHPPSQLEPQLKVHCFGNLQVLVGNRSITQSRYWRRKVETAFKYLITFRGRKVTKDALIEVLWSEADFLTGSNNLKVLMHSLKRALEPQLKAGQPSQHIVSNGDSYYFNTNSPYWIDVDEFLRRTRQAKELSDRGYRDEAISEYETAEKLYAGDYLEEDLYEDYCAAERETLTETYFELLSELSALHAAAGNYDRSIWCCRKALSKDSCREGIHRDLMRYFWAAGRRPEALQQYFKCKQVLQDELQVAPLPETERLYRLILASSGTPQKALV